MASSLDIWNTVIGILGFLSLICQLLFCIVQSKLPTAKSRVLESTLEETESLLRQCVEEGRLNNSAETAQFHRKLAKLRIRSNDIRVETLCAKTYIDDFRNMMKGLSRRTQHLCKDVQATRSDISTSSSSTSPRSLEEDTSLGEAQTLWTGPSRNML
ncbi:hypothetical protein C8Q78DRAFT_1080155 [Trametes maxima]|nr:hypothetical protein C8Q78DRAFT_1080155 [Trametes maxima]